MQNKTFESIKENKLFAWMDPAFISKIKIDQKRFLSYKKGCVIYRINDESKLIYLVVEGEVILKIYRYYKFGSTDSVVTKIKNDFFGEKEIIHRSPRSSAAVAGSDCLLYGLPIDELPKYLTRKLYYLNNAAFPDQEYLPKETKPEIQGETDKISIAGNSRFLRVEPPGKMFYYKELQQKPVRSISPAGKEEYIEIQTKATDPGLTWIKRAVPYLKNDSDERSRVPENDDNKKFPDIFDTKKIGSGELHNLQEGEADFKSGIKKLASALVNIGSSGNKINAFLIESARLMNCAGCDLFIADTSNNELIKWNPQKGDQIRFKIGLAITGIAAERQEILFSNDAACDPRFIPEYEGAEGTEIRSILSVPLLNKENDLSAVLSFTNKLSGGFNTSDKKSLELFSPFFSSFIEAAISGENAKKPELYGLIKNSVDIHYEIGERLNALRKYGQALYKMNLGSGVSRILDNMQIDIDCTEVYLVSLAEFMQGNISLEPESADINDILDLLLKRLAEFAESRNIKLLKKFNAVGTVLVDKKKFRLACSHLIKNYFRIMPSGGKIFVKTENEDGTVKAEFKAPLSGFVQIMTNDPAIPDKNIPRTDVLIAESIIKKSGGTLLEEYSDQWASITVSLPLVRNEIGW